MRGEGRPGVIWSGRERGETAPPGRGLWTVGPALWDATKGFKPAGGGGRGD